MSTLKGIIFKLKFFVEAGIILTLEVKKLW